MGHKKTGAVEKASDQKHGLFATSKALDPGLASLFASSVSRGPWAQKTLHANRMQSGPVEIPKRTARTLPEDDSIPISNGLASSENEEISISEAESSSASSSVVSERQLETERPRKRRRVEADDLEGAYFQRLAKEEEADELRRRARRPQSPNEALQDVSDDEGETKTVPEEHSSTLVHEALVSGSDDVEKSKVKRTVFLSNVSINAIRSKSSRKELLKHLESPFKVSHEEKDKAKVDSIRFRSTAYTGDSGPKKAGFATKNLMEQTTKSTNAYAVFSSEAGARIAAKELNGTVVLDRHLRIDHLAKPSGTDHKRCVFVGNLNFVDEETTEDEAEDPNSKPRRPKARQPADAEEGLWRAFAKVGKVENVRVVRDKHTRVGKGFAYVQFVDQNGVEAALLLNDKKFPPLLPRKLRVTRAKKLREKPANPSREKPRLVHRGGPLGGTTPRVGGARTADERRSSQTTSSKLVFEGHRASKSSLNDNKQKKRRSVKITSRSAKRGAAFKASGGKKKRDRKP